MEREEQSTLKEYGFEIIADEEGMDKISYTATCSGSRSDCCTRVCSADANFTESAEAWEKYLDILGGQVQY